jgi:tRNA-dihydrouridine synthase 2
METQVIDYRNKVVLAPMVRVGMLPTRLLALHYGADIVWGEEIIDKALLKSSRVVNEALGTVDFIRDSGNTLLYRTCQEDFPSIFQIGSSDAVTALKAAEIVSRDVNGIDLNMGCPKHFSVHAGMGAALLTNVEKATEILSTLNRNLNNSITCKIRLKSTVAETVDLLKSLESTGIKAVTIHCRMTHERPHHPAHWDILKEVISLKPINIPIIANGDVYQYTDIAKIKETTGADSVMIARGAIRNTSVFQQNTIPIYSVMQKYMEYAITTDNHYTNTKYTLQQIIKENNIWPNNGEGEGVVIYKAKDMRTLASLFKLEDFYDDFWRKLNTKKSNTNSTYINNTTQTDTTQTDTTNESKIEESSETEPPAKRFKV